MKDDALKLVLNGIMVKAWMSGSVQRAKEELDLICQEANLGQASPAEREAGRWICDNREKIIAVIRRVSLRDKSFNASCGVDQLMQPRRVPNEPHTLHRMAP